VGIVFGLVAVGAGVWGTVDGPSSGFFLVFTAASLVLTLFVLVLGVLLIRAAAVPPKPAAA
jgi:hypothetical protein